MKGAFFRFIIVVSKDGGITMLYEKYSQLSDEEMIRIIKDGDSYAIDYLMDKYKEVVKKKAKTLFLIGGEKEDLIQEGMIGLYKAIRDYQFDKENSFYSFADLCISRQMYSAINASNRKKNLPLNTYISLYTPINTENEDNEDKTTLADTMYLYNDLNPEKLVIDKEKTSMIEDELYKRLSDLEKQVLDLYLQDLKYQAIARVLNKEPKSIDNALQRIKTKLNQVLKEI